MNIRSVTLFSLLMVFCVVGYSPSAEAFRDRCPRHDVTTELKAKRSKTKFRRASLESINDYLNSHSVLAFVSPENLFVENQYKFEVVDVGGGWLCPKLEKVRSYFHVAASINMPKDFKKGSCEYEAILEHEKRHLKVIYDFHENNTDAYRRYLGIIARDVPVFKPVRTEEELARDQMRIQNYFQSKYNALIHKSLAEMNIAQENIDSNQEYLFRNRMIDRCHDEDPKRPNRKSFPDHTLD